MARIEGDIGYSFDFGILQMPRIYIEEDIGYSVDLRVVQMPRIYIEGVGGFIIYTFTMSEFAGKF